MRKFRIANVTTIKTTLFAALLAVLSASSFGQTTASFNLELPARFTPDVTGHLFTLAGSNTIGARLAPTWARTYLEQKGATEVKIQLLPNANEFRVQGYNGKQPVYIDIQAHGSGTGFEGLKKNSAAIAMSSRAIKMSEREELQTLGDLTLPAYEHVVAIDGLAVIVNTRNTIRSLSIEQIGLVFSGKIANWNELGGPNQKITIYARDQNSGTWDSFNNMILKDRLPLAANALRFESSDVLSDRVANDPNGIGFVGLASIKNTHALAITDGHTNPVEPSAMSVATEDYPLARRLYLYTPASPVNLFAQEFVAFAQHTTGQRMVEQVGFVSQNPYALTVKINDGPEFYRELAAQGQRLSMNFRFRHGEAQLDNKAKRDIDRLANYLKQNGKQNLRIQLVGFSDQKKDDDSATLLSKLRANAVKIELFNQGISTEAVEGYGAERLIADPQDERRNRNDRVEVWVYPASVKIAPSSQRPNPTGSATLRYAKNDAP